ncbi:MAG: pyridoxal phosphate-dependent aminotransferase [Desulfobacterales bacterium]
MSITMVGRHMADIPFSSIRRVFERAARLTAAGTKVINFGIGRPDFDTPGHIKAAAKKALDEGFVHYTPNSGVPALRQAIAASIQKYKQVSYGPETEIMVTAGGQEAIFLSLRALLNPGDEILVPDPGYTQLVSAIRLAGGVALPMPLSAGDNFMPDLEAAGQLIGPQTRGIVVNSPHNPTGAVLDPDQIAEIGRFAEVHGLVVFSDEAYDRILFPGVDFSSPAALPGMKNRTVIWGSLSKTYAMTGWRVGYLAAPRELIAAAVRVQQNVLLSACSFAQAGAVAALDGPQECVDEMVAEFDRRRKIILDGIAAAPGLTCPTIRRGAFYVFVRHVAADMNSAQLADYILDKAGVAVIPGTPFGKRGEGFLRISYATSQAECREGMARIAEVMDELAADR